MGFRRSACTEALAKQLFELSRDETLALVGRCPEKGCRHGKRIEVHGITMMEPGDAGYEFGNTYRGTAEDCAPVRKGYTFASDDTRWVGTGSWLTHTARELYRCEEHDRAYEFKGIIGVFVATHVCDAACTEATGEKCRCSCGGANHGRDAS